MVANVKAKTVAFGAAGRKVTAVRPDRAGKRLIAGHFDAAIAREMKMLAAARDTTMQQLLREAVDLLFSRYGVKVGRTPPAEIRLKKPLRH